MAEQTKLIQANGSEERGEDFTQVLRGRQTREIVIAFCGPVGSDIKVIKKATRRVFEEKYNYKVYDIKVSDLISKYCIKAGYEIDKEDLGDIEKKYPILQKAGNELRQKFGTDILGKLAVTKIKMLKEMHSQDKEKGKKEDGIKKNVYLIDSLKNPGEVAFLRAVYRNMFYLAGVFCSGEVRKANLMKMGISSTIADEIMTRDRREGKEHGQQLNNTLQYADIFINNNNPHPDKVNPKIERCINLLLGEPFIAPTIHEYAMYIAHSASMRSGCISRQIGAAIINSENEIVSTGYNDAPKYGGGLYSPEDAASSARCIDKSARKCHNSDDIEKKKGKIKNILQGLVGSKGEIVGKAAEKIVRDTKIEDITEYSRSVHAEMEAIISCARNGISTKNGSLYCTTFPCHNCARHIVGAGIKKVYFIEPYEKSKALYLHDDSIKLEPKNPDKEDDHVHFSHFEGVAPRQFINFFKRNIEGKKDGIGVEVKREDAMPSLPEYLDTWLTVEEKVVEHVTKDLGLLD